MSKHQKRKKVIQVLNKISKRIHFKGFSKKNFEYTKSKLSTLKFEMKLHALLLKEQYKQLINIHYTKETNVALTQLVLSGTFNSASIVLTTQQAKNIEQLKTNKAYCFFYRKKILQ